MPKLQHSSLGIQGVTTGDLLWSLNAAVQGTECSLLQVLVYDLLKGVVQD